MNITAPFGYDEIVPLRKTHRVLLPVAGSIPAFCRTLNALAVSFAEFVAAGHDYPLVFASLDEGRTFAPVAVLGLGERRNAFIDDAGAWDPGVYLPAFVRRYPFCISKVYVDGAPNDERVVCVASAYLDPAGVALFDAQGQATAQWAAQERLLAEYESDLDRTAEFSAALARLRLLVPFRFEVLEGDLAHARLSGMYRVDVERLQDLKAASLKALVAKDYLDRIYAHVHSLENFTRLYARESARERWARAHPGPIRRPTDGKS